MTDTVKTVVDERIPGTIDREGQARSSSPPGRPTAAPSPRRCARRPPTSRLLPPGCASAGPAELVKGPSMARRVEDESAVNLLECLDEVGRRVHEG